MSHNPPLPPKSVSSPRAQPPLPTQAALQQAQPQQQGFPLPEQGWLPDILHDKSKDDLAHVLSTPSLQTALLHADSTAHPSLSASTAPLQSLISSNVSLASNILALEQHLSQRRDQVSAHLLSVKALEQQWRKKQSEMETRLEAFGPRVLHGRLGASITEQEAINASVEDSFLEDVGGEGVSEREVGEWVKRVREGRKRVYLRKERRARWDEGRVGGWR